MPPDANGTAESAKAPALAEDKKPIELKPPPGPVRRPKQLLPTTRIAAAKQIDLLRAFDAAAGTKLVPVGLADVGKVAGMAANTISLATPFFASVGLLVKDGQKFLPASAVHDYVVAFEWQPDVAAHRLSPAFRSTWFWEELEAQLKFKQSMRETEVEALLAQKAEATQDYRQNIQWIIAFLEIVGLISRDSGTVRFGPAYAQTSFERTPQPAESELPTNGARETSVPTTGVPAVPASASKAGAAGLTTSFTQQPEGALTFHVSVRVEMSEMKDWHPDRIAALFAGVAQVLAAKANVEKDAANE
jgi:hypothetical protein